MGNKGRMHGGISSILIGTSCSIVMCLVGLAGLTQMVLLEKAGERGIAIIVPVLLLISSLLGCRIVSIHADRNQLVAIAVTTGLFVFVMIIAGLIMDGTFQSVLLNVGAVVAGGMISCVLCLKKPAKGTRRKRRYR